MILLIGVIVFNFDVLVFVEELMLKNYLFIKVILFEDVVKGFFLWNCGREEVRGV